MSFTERLMAQGQWNLSVKESTPEQITDLIAYAGHIVVTSERIDINAMSDSSILAQARYVGVVTRRPTSETPSFGGPGLVWWLGSRDRGKILRGASAINWTNQTFDGAITEVLTSPTAIVKGLVQSTAGTYTSKFDLVTQRRVIEALMIAYGTEYRINNDFTADFGASGWLYNSAPSSVIARKFSGRDPNTRGLMVNSLSVDDDIEDFTTTAIVAAEGTGGTLVTAEQSLSDKLFIDPQGNPIDRSFVSNEPSTSSANASAHAQAYLDEFGVVRKAVKVDLIEFDVEGDFSVGDLVYFWDPKTELVDPANELSFRGQTLNPIAIRIVSVTDSIRSSNGVYYRDTETPPNYVDLTDHFQPETGTVKIEVGVSSRSLTEQTSASLDARISIDPDGNDTLSPDVPAHASTPWASTTYLDSQGIRKSRIVPVWDTPLNTDGSTVTDGSHYTIRYRQNGQTEYQYQQTNWGVNTAVLQELSPGVVYEISVSASDVNGNSSGYATDQSVTAAQASGVPSQPSAPTVSGNVLNIQVVHDLTKNGGGNLESDLDHLVVYGSTSSGFTPSSANRLGEIGATASHITLGIPVVGSFQLEDTSTRYIVVTAVDREGNESAKSPQSTVTANLIDNQHISSLSASKLTAGTINASVISVVNLNASNISTGTLNAARIGAGTIGVEVIKLSNSSNSRIESSDGSSLIIRGNGQLTATNATIAGAITATSGSLSNLTISGTLTLGSGGVIRTAASGARVELASTTVTDVVFYSGSPEELSAPYMSTNYKTGGVDQWIISQWDSGSVTSGQRARIDMRAFKGTSGTGTEILLVGGVVGVGTSLSPPVTWWRVGSAGVIQNVEQVMYANIRFNSGVIRLTNGSASAPSYTFDSDTNTGFYRASTDQFAFTAGGTQQALVHTGGVRGRALAGSFWLKSAIGTVGAPTYAFYGDTDTGAYRSGPDEYAISAGGAVMARFLNTTINEIRMLPIYSATGSGDSTVGVTSTGFLRRQTSALKTKRNVEHADWLHRINLQPVEYDTKPTDSDEADDAHRYGLIADWIAEQVPDAGVYGEDGEIEDFQNRAVLAILAAQIIDLRKEMEQLKEAA